MVPDLFSMLAYSPAALAGNLQPNEALQHGELSGKPSETVSLAAAQLNQCAYCLSAHTLMRKGRGLSPDAIVQALEGSGDAVAVLTRQILHARRQIGDAELTEAKFAGLSDAQIVEVAAAVALDVITNYLNNVAGTELDFPSVEL